MKLVMRVERVARRLHTFLTTLSRDDTSVPEPHLPILLTSCAPPNGALIPRIVQRCRHRDVYLACQDHREGKDDRA
jgi:hypothetical protein